MKIYVLTPLVLFSILGSFAYSQHSLHEFFTEYARKQGIYTDQNYRDSWEQGLEYFQSEEYQRAADFFGKAALISSQHPLPNLYLAYSLFAIEEYPQAGKAMRRVVSLYPDWSNVPIQTQKVFPTGETLSRQLAHLEKWAFEQSRSLDVYFLYGFLNQFCGETRKAEIAYKVILSRDPCYREAAIFLAMLLGQPATSTITPFHELSTQGKNALQNQQYLEAVEIWSTVCFEYQDQADGLYCLSYSLAACGYFEQAGATLRMAIARFPDKLKSQSNSHTQWIKMDSGWIGSLEEYLQNHSQQIDILMLLMYFYVTMGEEKKAQIALKHANKLRPQDGEIDEIGKLLREIPPKDGEFPLRPIPPKQSEDAKSPKSNEKSSVESRSSEKSEKSSTESRSSEKSSAESKSSEREKSEEPKEKDWLKEGKKNFRQQQYHKAAQIFTQIMADTPQNTEAHWLLGLTTFATGQYSYSYRFFKSLLTNATIPAWESYYEDRKIFAQHLETLNEWVRKNPKDDSALFVLGVILLGSEKRRQAFTVFATLRNRLPNDAEVSSGYELAEKVVRDKK